LKRFYYTWNKKANPNGSIWATDMDEAAEDLLRDHPQNARVWIRTETSTWWERTRHFELAQQPATQPKRAKFASTKATQRVLLTGLDCRAGQADLFEGVDGTS
jgi:hypothetical protein